LKKFIYYLFLKFFNTLFSIIYCSLDIGFTPNNLSNIPLFCFHSVVIGGAELPASVILCKDLPSFVPVATNFCPSGLNPTAVVSDPFITG
jgi:hypothetical protein